MNRIEDIVNQLNNKERMQECYKINQEHIRKLEEYRKLREQNNYSRRKYYIKIKNRRCK